MRVALCLALSVALSGCMTTKQAISKAYGYDNGLLVRAVASIDKAWFIEDRGLVLYGEVTPGRWYGDPLRFDPNDDPPTSLFVAALTLKELDSRRPRLHIDRFHAGKAEDPHCIAHHMGGKFVSVKQPQNVELVDPRYVSPWEMKLDDQSIRIAPLGNIARVYDVKLGPSGGDWLYYPMIPVAAVSDLVRYVGSAAIDRLRGELPAVSSSGERNVCEELEALLFPRVQPPPSRLASGR